MRSRIDWLAYAILIGALAGCASSQSSDGSGSSDAAVSGDDSHADAGKSSSTSSGTTKTGSSTSSSTKSDAGTAGTGSKSDGGANKSDAGTSSNDDGKGDAGGAAANGGKSDDGSTSSGDLPNDGNQLSLCSMAQGDCNKGLACSATSNALSNSRGYCSKICASDDDCAGVEPSASKYTCSSGNGTKVCEIACTGTDDKSCPSNMECVQTGVTVEPAANGGSGGGMAPEPRAGAAGAGGRASPFVPVYHCKYPLITSPLWGPCQDGQHQCDQDATCYGTGAGRAGVCTKSCTMDSDCSEKPSSGSITPSCATITPARGMTMETKLCVLSCLDAKDGCPDGTTCVDGPRTQTGNGRGGMGMGRGMGMGNAGSGSTSEPSYARCE
jgi:hypothetical protein